MGVPDAAAGHFILDRSVSGVVSQNTLDSKKLLKQTWRVGGVENKARCYHPAISFGIGWDSSSRRPFSVTRIPYLLCQALPRNYCSSSARIKVIPYPMACYVIGRTNAGMSDPVVG